MNRRGWRRRTRLARVSVGIVATLVLAVVAITTLDVHQQRSSARRQLEDRGRLLATTLTDSFANALYFSDIERVRYLTELFETQPEVSHFAVFDQNGRILVSSEVDSYPKGEIDERLLLIAGGDEPAIFETAEHETEVVAPIRVGGQTLGGLRLLLDPTVAAPLLRRRMLIQLAQGLLVLFLGMALAIGLARALKMADDLWETEERLRLLAENVREALWMTDLNTGKLLYLSPAYAQIWEQSDAVAFANPVSRYDSVHADDRARVIEGSDQERDVVYRINASDGTIRWIRERTALVLDGQQNLLVGAADDITEQKRLEMDLLHAQKMESLGRLAGGVAHDFNNLLTGILGFASLGEEAPDSRDEVEEFFREIRKAAESGADLTNQMLSFSRHQVTEARPVNLGALIRDCSLLLQRVLGEDVALEIDIEPDLGSVRIDPGQFEQVLMNLVVNARESMPNGGLLLIEASTLNRGEQDFIKVRVHDTGIGIPEELQERIFEPFFSTKTEKKGTGMGLATCYGIVRQHGGHIELESVEGRGSAFDVFLPRVEDELDGERVDPEEQYLSLRGSETILIAEDDPTVLALTSRSLSSLGYSILEAADGEQALATAEAHEGTIDLLVTDVVMPNVGGRELATRLTRLRPRILVLYMSGYAADEIRSRDLIDEGLEFLAKPFLPKDLAIRVRRILEADKGGRRPRLVVSN